jgi:hypothetical protein
LLLVPAGPQQGLKPGAIVTTTVPMRKAQVLSGRMAKAGRGWISPRPAERNVKGIIGNRERGTLRKCKGVGRVERTAGRVIRTPPDGAP